MDQPQETHKISAFSDETDYEVPFSKEASVPKFLRWTYWILPIWGIFAMYYYFNGSSGWLDRGYWHQLQIAANTTFPIENHDLPSNDKNILNSSGNSD